MKVKIFNHSDPGALEKEINRFLKHLPEDDFIDIKLSSTGDADGQSEGNIYDMVLIVYRDAVS